MAPSDDVLYLATRIHNRIVFIHQVRKTIRTLDKRMIRKGQEPPLEDFLKNLDELSDEILDEIDRLCVYTRERIEENAEPEED